MFQNSFGAMTTRDCPGISYLKREQLSYECRVRGLSDDGTVPQLAARLREAVTNPLQLSPGVFGEVGALLLAVSNSIEDLSSNIQFLEGTQPTARQVCRVQAQLSHFKNRLGDLVAINITEQQSQVKRELLQKICELQDRTVLLTLQDDSVQHQQQGLGSNAGNVNYTQREPEVVYFTPDSFAKLPNPIMVLFNGVSTLTIDNLEQVQRVLWLLEKLRFHAESLSVPQSVILSLLYPLAKGALSELLSEVLKQQGNIELLKRQIINRSLSPSMRIELERRFYWKVQGTTETLSQYTDRVRTAVAALNMNVTEAEAIATILEGMRAEDRSCLVFAERPKNFQDLQTLLSSVEAVMFADQQRKNEQQSLQNVTESRTHTVNPSTRIRRCFRCGAQNHLVRDCTVFRKARPNS